MIKIKKSLLFLSIAAITACNSNTESKGKENIQDKKPDIKLVDEKATESTKQLYAKLLEMSKKGFMFGHQDALSYGMGWKYAQEPGRCDVNELTGDYPGVFGWDIGHLEIGSPMNLDSVNFEEMKSNIVKAHQVGGVNTISWHPLNPVTGGSSWDNKPTVEFILPGGSHHDKYNDWLDKVGDFLKSLESETGEKIPIIWRPYHEHNGGWFWWGEETTSVEDYVSLWKYTVHYLKDTLQVHNLLWAYSPNLFENKEEYLKKYPGDDYVDILGCDVYDLPQYGINYKEKAPLNIKMLKEIGKEKNKVYAFTETGQSSLTDDKWWTESLLPAIDSSGVAWVLVWRNAHQEHFYASYKGHSSAEDFVEFYNHPQSLFAKDVKSFVMD